MVSSELTPDDARRELLYLLNELRAMGTNEQRAGDRELILKRLLALRNYVTAVGAPLDVVNTCREILRREVQA